ncbi:MAG: CoA-transferase, partial [Alphaproteobacteria bacterium]
MTDYRTKELLIDVIARLLEGVENIAVGVLSPIPGSAAILAQSRAGGAVNLTMITDREFDEFFLSGGQIDGAGNINLLGVGDYPGQQARWSGSFGSAFLYYLVPRVILFREEHTKRTLVEKVDFISAAGSNEPGVYRPGGPHALVTNRCLFMFDKARGRFRLESVHPGESVESVRDNTGFDFDCPTHVPETPVPSTATLKAIRQDIAPKIA